MGGFTIASSPSPPTSEDESDDGFGSDDADEDDGASSPSFAIFLSPFLSLHTSRL